MMKSSWRASFNREPIKRSTFSQVKRTSVMHLKPYHKLPKKDPSLEPSLNATRDHVHHRSTANEGKYTPTCTKLNLLSTPSNASYCRPWETIPQKKTCNASGKEPVNRLDVKTKLNSPAVTIHHGEEGEGTLDICAIIKPGNTKEKIAFFASHQCGNNQIGTMKVKSTWNINGRAAKRRKKSVELVANNHVGNIKGANVKFHQFEPFACGIEHCSVHYMEEGNTVFSDGSISVIEMVAFLEQRASALLSDSTKRCTHPSTATRPTVPSKGVLSVSEHFAALGPCERASERGSFESNESENQTICVLDMVAKLESECLKHQRERNTGSLSRNNSFRRNVERMLLTSGSHHDASEVDQGSSETGESKADGGGFMHQENYSSSESLLSKDPESAMPCKNHLLPGVENFYMCDFELDKGTSVKIGSHDIKINMDPVDLSFSLCSKAVEFGSYGFQYECVSVDCTSEEVVRCSENNSSQTATDALVCVSESEEAYAQEKSYHLSVCEDPLPGTLFFHHPNQTSGKVHAQLSDSSKDHSQGITPIKVTLKDKASKNKQTVFNSGAVSVSHVEIGSLVLDTPLKRNISHDFLTIRYKIQKLLEPQQYMAFLPHHIMVNIFRFLPTKTLAALKCTCHDFRFIIEHYDIRPVDSLWVRDLRYKDDPCKQCKKRCVRGDVSLCWWHPKPYCQAVPYGPGYWMCCHRPHKESPGCKVGLHDNRWVPACHSFNRQMYKK